MPSGPVDANDRLRIIYPLYLKRKCHDRFQWDDGQNQTLELELLSKSQIINVKTVKESAINCESLDVYDDGKNTKHSRRCPRKVSSFIHLIRTDSNVFYLMAE